MGSVCIMTGWGIYSHPHTSWSLAFHIFLSYLYVYLRAWIIYARHMVMSYRQVTLVMLAHLSC